MEPIVGQQYTFGAGTFEWVPFASGTWGFRAPDGRQFDAIGNPLREGFPASSGQQARTTIASGNPPQPENTGLVQQQTQARALLDFLGRTPPNKINAYAFNRLPTSVKTLTLAGYESLGRDPGDVQEEIQNLLPKASGPSRGYIAPLGR